MAIAGLVAGVLALTACSSSDGASSPSDGAAETSPDTSGSDPAAPAADVEQNRPVTVTGAALAPFDNPVEDLAIGEVAPVVAGQSFDGTPITLGGPTENPTMIVFLAHWCPHCNDEVPVLTGLNDAGELPAGLDVIGVSTAVAADRPNYPPSEWVVEKGWPWPTMADDETLTAISAMGGTSFPFTIVLDTDGTVLARRAGEASAADTTAFLAAALA